MRQPLGLIALLLAAALLAFLFALLSGSATISVADLGAALSRNADPQLRALLLELRLPRALTAFAVGGLLAVAGVYMQLLLRNPLAEPYVLGTSGGAAVAALTAMTLGATAVLIDTAAFAGAIGSALLVFVIARGTGSWTPTRMLLTGVVLAAGYTAATTLLLALSPEQALRGMLFWLMGDLSFAYSPGRLLILLVLTGLPGWLFARHLDVLARGELQAKVLGLPVTPVRSALFVATALAVAASVTAVGVIGFVGLVVPHMVRLAAGSAHRIVIPAATLGGGTLLVVADTLARSLVAPRQLPVGALTAALGVPLFLLLMSRAGRVARRNERRAGLSA